ncbi:MAG: phosphate ABC transporter permease subunit PstC, partial [Kiritimatiellae bacterium]|nr:phosphate ABC transporter permease subunit PstC [Kiritimatiellia bacterium]
YFIGKDAIPFFTSGHIKEFFTGAEWFPSGEPAEFGALSLFIGSIMVTIGAAIIAVPLGISAAVCLSDVLPFNVRQIAKPIIEVLAAIPSVAYGFFALVVLAPLLQNNGGKIMAITWFTIATPLILISIFIISDLITAKMKSDTTRLTLRAVIGIILGIAMFSGLYHIGIILQGITITTGTNALNVSIILGIMSLPTIVSVAEDALQTVGRELREGSFALGATRAETLIKVIIPAASSGIYAAILLGVMRALGETMVVWMASGNAAQVPHPIYNYLEPIRTMTATIAGDMGEADHVTGSARFHVLFMLGLCLLAFCFITNLLTERIIAKQRKKLRGE